VSAASRIVKCAPHTQAVFDVSTLPRVVKWAEDILLRHRVDALVVCGHSGILLAGALAYAMRVPVFAARKENEPTVTGWRSVSAVAPNGKAQRWAWVDDCIGSGGTMRRSVAAVKEAGLIETAVPEVILLYDSGISEDQPLREVDGYCREFHLSHQIEVPRYGFRV
jgi:adenine/guanine phosphoribosyltransferase-like PRPP-binding protein